MRGGRALFLAAALALTAGWGCSESVVCRNPACGICAGRGQYPCARCEGKGAIPCPACNGRNPEKCPTCHGAGRVRCSLCSGRGVRTHLLPGR